MEEVEALGKGLYIFSGSRERFRLVVETLRIKLAYEYNTYFAVSISKINPVSHQPKAVYDYILPKPKIRFLLANDLGAGKTIMVGLLNKELKYRGAVERTLLVTPPSLNNNWIREMKNKFGETLIEINRSMKKSFEMRIYNGTQKLKELEAKAMIGRDMDLAIRMAKERFERLIQRKDTTLK